MLRQTLRIFLQLIPGTELRHWLTETKNDRFAPRFVRPTFQLTLDGFPRSANSWIYFQVQLAFPDAVIAHHVHSWQQFLFSRFFSVPSVLLVRHPDAAVQSLVTKRGGSMALGYLEYTLTNSLAVRFATHVRFFDDLIEPQGLQALLDYLAKEMDCVAQAIDSNEVEGLMARRVHPKNVKTPPLCESRLGPIARIMRRLAHHKFRQIERKTKLKIETQF